MKKINLSSRTIEFLVGILATLMIATGLFLYALQEPSRILTAQASLIMRDLDNSMTLYAENCSVCHGSAGEGIGATPPLNTPALQSADPASLTKIIARGLFNTAMPAWSQVDGGPLSDYQIGLMTLLIQQGDWKATQERVISMGLEPRLPFTTQADSAILESLAALPNGEILGRAVTLYAENCVACHGPDGLGSALAPALNDPKVQQKTTGELARIIQNGVPGTLMAGWEAKLSQDDMDALLALMAGWEDVPVGAIPAPNQQITVTTESLAMGADLYLTNCARCHGPDGQGTQRAPGLNIKSVLTTTNDAALQQIISLGIPGTSMPAWGDRLLDDEIKALIGFIRSWEPSAPDTAIPLRGPWWRSQGTGRTGRQPGSQDNSQALPSGGVAPQVSSLSAGVQAGGVQQSVPWWQGLDWRAFALVAGALWLAFSLIGAAIGGLRNTK